MTTPKRYEEMAEGWACDTGCLCNMHKDDLVEALRTAAREAQVRVLDLAIAACPSSGSFAEHRLLALKARLDSGEDL